jgi:hypothetical protein
MVKCQLRINFAGLLILSLLLTSFLPSACAQDRPVTSNPDAVVKRADLIRLKTGVVLIGQLTAIEKGRLKCLIADIGELTIKTAKISCLQALSGQFLLDLEGERERVYGQLDSTSREGYCRLITVTGSREIALADIIYLQRKKISFKERLSGTINIGYSYTTSNNIGRFTAGNLAMYGNDRYNIFQHFTGIYTTGDGTGMERIDLGLGAYYTFKGKWLLLQYLQWQRLLATGVNGRTISSTGAGARIVHNRWADLSALTGISFQKENAINGVSGSIQSELPLMIDGKIVVFSPDLTLRTMAIYFRSLSEPGRHRWDLRSNLDMVLFKNFTAGVQLLYNAENRPLLTTAHKSDVNFSLVFGYRF